MTIAHVVARVSADDPHTLGVLGIADALAGAEPGGTATSTVFAAEVASIEGVHPIAELAHAAPLVIVYHPRGAAPALVRGLVDSAEASSGRLAVVDDGAPLDPLARRDLQLLARSGAVGLATSDGAAERLSDLGVATVVRVPPVVAGNALAAVEAFAPTTNHLDVSVPGPLVLTVDDGSTAAQAARVIQAFHVVRTYLARTGHLAIAIPTNPDLDEAAVLMMCREVWGLRLTDAWAHRLVYHGERAALTRRASVFVTAAPAVGDTRHALAAMAEGVPVVAPADAGAAGVLGAGALLLPPDAGAAVLAEAVAEVLHDERRRAFLVESAARAIAQFAPEIVAPIWRTALAA